jgi:ribose transport system substrate-binding protein
MGELALRAAVDHLRGKPVEPRTDTGAELLDRKNKDEPAIRALVKPDLAKWLN